MSKRAVVPFTCRVVTFIPRVTPGIPTLRSRRAGRRASVAVLQEWGFASAQSGVE